MSYASEDEVWIYHERQAAALCGQHALNNLVQECIFSAESLAEIAQQLDEMELTFMADNDEGGIRSKDYQQRLHEGSGNVDEQGNFSIQVLQAALQNLYGIKLLNLAQKSVLDTANIKDITDIDGFICNKESHWFTIRKINNRYWNLNSTLELPTSISHFKVATTIENLQNQGYSVFIVVTALAGSTTSTKSYNTKQQPRFWWKEKDLLTGTATIIGSAAGSSKHSWDNVGSGMRLDGKSSSSIADNAISSMHDYLTEEEMLQMALAASLESNEPEKTSENDDVDVSVPTPPEPPKSVTTGVARIQFRLPNGSRKVRRFLQTDKIAGLYAYVKDVCDKSSALKVLYGFPPKDLQSFKDKTIGDMKLAGESIQIRQV